MAYVSIFEKLIAEMEEKGHKTYRATFKEDSAAFNLPPEMLPSKKLMELQNTPEGTTKDSKKLDPNKTNQVRLPGSSTIQSAAYWPDRAYLLVSFKSGHTYSYDEVGPWTIGEWEKAASAGSWFYYNIRTSFKYQKMS